MSTPAYWWDKQTNFGDRLSGLLLAYFADVDPVWAPPAQAKVICVGSILEHMPASWPGLILGAGKLHETSKPPALRSAQILALRGPLSAVGVRGDFALGDPALLADVLAPVANKTHDLGILPHWSDQKLVARELQYDANALVISPHSEPLDVLRQIGSCRRLVTSSLHGMIVADAYGLPRRFQYTSTMDKDGRGFKFRDYSAAIQTGLLIGEWQRALRNPVEDRRSELIDAFRALGAQLR